MKTRKPCEVVEIKCQRHKLPLEVILFHMVDFKAIKTLPLNQDCTDILMVASQRVLDRMFINGEAFVETFMPRRREFESLLAEEIKDYKNGQWLPQKKTAMTTSSTHNSVVMF